MAIKSIATDNTGWLDVLLVSQSGTQKVPVPEFLRVDYEGRRINVPKSKFGQRGAQVIATPSGKIYPADRIQQSEAYFFPGDKEGQERDFFTILEGPYRGKKAAVTARTGGSWFHEQRVTPAAHLVFTMAEEKGSFIYGPLKFGGTEVVAFTEGFNAIPVGEYVLELPDSPHGGGRQYMGACERPMTWFRAGNHGSRYLHPGSNSLGCITVPPENWNPVYRYVATARKGDGINAGVVKVVLGFK